MTDAEKKELEQAEFRKLKLMVELDMFETFTGEEQVKYIDGLKYGEGSKFLNENFSQLKKDAPAPKNKYRMDRDLILFFTYRKYPFNPDSVFLSASDISGIDFSKTNIEFKQWNKARYIYGATLPIKLISQADKFIKIQYSDFPTWLRSGFGGIEISAIDFTGLSFRASDLSRMDLSKTNITAKQLIQAKSIVYCILPAVDFTGLSFIAKDISGVDFSRTNITANQFFQASRVSDCKLPAVDFTGLSFVTKDISGVDFSQTNITFPQWIGATNIAGATLPIRLSSKLDEFFTFDNYRYNNYNIFTWLKSHKMSIDYTDCSFENMNISGIDFSDTNISGKQFCEANNDVRGCLLPKGIDFAGCSFKDMNISGLDFSETDITGEQFCEANSDVSGCKLSKGISFIDCSFDGKDISGIDFTKTDVNFTQLLKASRISGVKLPKGLNLKGNSLEGLDISNIDFSKTNITFAQWIGATNIKGATLLAKTVSGEVKTLRFPSIVDDPFEWLRSFDKEDSRKLDFDFKSCSLEGKNISGIDFRQSNISPKQFLKARVFQDCLLPKGFDFKACSFEGKSLVGIDFSEVNIKFKQWLQAKYIKNCKLPIKLNTGEVVYCSTPNEMLSPMQCLAKFKIAPKYDFKGCSFKGKDIDYMDFSQSNITKKQLDEALSSHMCRVPNSVALGEIVNAHPKEAKPAKAKSTKPKATFEDLSGQDFTHLDISGRDFSKSNLSVKQLRDAKSIYGVKLPKGMEFTDATFINKNCRDIDFSLTKLTATQWLKAKVVAGCKLPKTMNFKGINLSGRDISGVDFSLTNITKEQLSKAKNTSGCKFPKGIKL